MCFLSKNTNFHVRSYRKSLQNLVQNAFEKTLSENQILSGFEVDFGKLWTTEVPTNIVEKRSPKNIENRVPKPIQKNTCQKDLEFNLEYF